jgi:hypothetical protein
MQKTCPRCRLTIAQGDKCQCGFSCRLADIREQAAEIDELTTPPRRASAAWFSESGGKWSILVFPLCGTVWQLGATTLSIGLLAWWLGFGVLGITFLFLTPAVPAALGIAFIESQGAEVLICEGLMGMLFPERTPWRYVKTVSLGVNVTDRSETNTAVRIGTFEIGHWLNPKQREYLLWTFIRKAIDSQAQAEVVAETRSQSTPAEPEPGQQQIS